MHLANEDCRSGMEVCLRDWDDIVADYGVDEDGYTTIKLANGDIWYVTNGSQYTQDGLLTVKDVFNDPSGKGFFLTLDGWSGVALEANSFLPRIWFSQCELKRANAETNNIQFEEDCFLRMLGIEEGS